MKLRFIGGSAHGEVKDVREGAPYLRVALRNEEYGMYYGSPLKYPDSFIRYEEYVRETIAFENSCRIEVMVLTTLSVAAKWRRIADFVEGV